MDFHETCYKCSRPKYLLPGIFWGLLVEHILVHPLRPARIILGSLQTSKSPKSKHKYVLIFLPWMQRPHSSLLYYCLQYMNVYPTDVIILPCLIILTLTLGHRIRYESMVELCALLSALVFDAIVHLAICSIYMQIVSIDPVRSAY